MHCKAKMLLVWCNALTIISWFFILSTNFFGWKSQNASTSNHINFCVGTRKILRQIFLYIKNILNYIDCVEKYFGFSKVKTCFVKIKRSFAFWIMISYNCIGTRCNKIARLEQNLINKSIINLIKKVLYAITYFQLIIKLILVVM